MRYVSDRDRAFAEQILRRAGGAAPTTENLIATTDEVFDRLAKNLSLVLGPEGYGALLDRSLQMARTEQPILDQVSVDVPGDGSRLRGLDEAVAGHDQSEAHAACVALVASFLNLLATLIGDDLTARLVNGALTTPGPQDSSQRPNSD